MVDYGILAPLALVNVVDAISYMVVAPSIVFYVLEMGGTQAQYGLILSAFSFASFATKPLLGYWSDAPWGSFRVPYFFSTLTAALGGVVYFMATMFATPSYAVGAILLGRILGGVGAANSALAFAYLAKTMPQEHLTRANIVLSMLRILGMAVGPVFNVFLGGVRGHIHLFGYMVELTSLNSVGLVLAASNFISFVAIFASLKEPNEECNSKPKTKESESDHHVGENSNKLRFFRSFVTPKVLIPILSIFSFNAAFQIIETGFPPAANHSMGWGPVQTSAVLGGTSIIITFSMMVVFFLSSKGVSDEELLISGLSVSIIGNVMMYVFWKAEGQPWQFYIPIVLSCVSFPFMAAPTRSVFTKSISSDPVLADKQGFMQAVLGMSASLAGFVTPSFVAVLVLREASAVSNSTDKRELTPVALFAAILPFLTLLGVIYLYLKKDEEEILGSDEDEENPTSETSGLLDSTPTPRPSRRRSSIIPIEQRTSNIEIHRRSSVQMMGGIVQFDIPEDLDD